MVEPQLIEKMVALIEKEAVRIRTEMKMAQH